MRVVLFLTIYIPTVGIKNIREDRKMSSKKMFSKNFIMVVIGQIISLFGNAILRFALPLYLLNETQSPALFGVVSACSFIPMILLSPIGGLLADRINKRNIMVILDYFTAALIFILTVLLGRVNLVALLLVVLILLYGIQGAYQPTVQASIPALVTEENLMPANAVINLINSLSGLMGPVIGGTVFGFAGIRPILIIGIVCFVFSATMEIFIQIPFEKQKEEAAIFIVAAKDMKESLLFVKKDKPVIGKVSFLIAGINLFLSALIIIGLPIVVTQMLGFGETAGNRFYGYAQGVLAAGGLMGGLLAGVIGKKMTIQNAHWLLEICSLALLPIGLVLWFPVQEMAAYMVIVASCFFMMMASSMFSIQMMAYVQLVTPSHLVGKIMSLVMCICMMAQPLGQAMYGILFEELKPYVAWLFWGAMLICGGIALYSRKLFHNLS